MVEGSPIQAWSLWINTRIYINVFVFQNHFQPTACAFWRIYNTCPQSDPVSWLTRFHSNINRIYSFDWFHSYPSSYIASYWRALTWHMRKRFHLMKLSDNFRNSWEWFLGWPIFIYVGFSIQGYQYSARLALWVQIFFILPISFIEVKDLFHATH